MNNKKILFIGSHPDDVEISCGGYVFKLLQNNEIHIHTLTDCEISTPNGFYKGEILNEWVESMKFIKPYHNENHCHTFNVREIFKKRDVLLDLFINLQKNNSFDMVVCHSVNDFHQDHKTIAEEGVRVFKKDTSIIGYELPWNNLAFNPQLLVRLTDEQVERKWATLSSYESQFTIGRNYFSKELIFGWARMRVVQCNAEYAEAFEVIRWIMR